MENPALKLIVFDLGHVLADFDWEEVCAGFARFTRKSEKELRHTFVRCSQLGYEDGKIDTAGFLSALNQRLGTALCLADFKRLWVATFCENREMAELLTVLKKQCPLYLLSNTNELHFDYMQEQYNISRHFAELILSYEVGCVKPDPAIYHEVLRRSRLSPEQCLFVDDLELNVQAARSVGLQAIRFTGVPELKKQLSGLGFRTDNGC